MVGVKVGVKIFLFYIGTFCKSFLILIFAVDFT
jgi:hypothetical protein